MLVIVTALAAFLSTSVIACSAQEADPGLAAPTTASQLYRPQLDTIATLLFPNGWEGYVIRFEGKIVGGGRSLVATKWQPGGPGGLAVGDFQTLLGGSFARTGTGLAEGRPERLAELYVSAVQPFVGQPARVFNAAFNAPPPAGEKLIVIERPDCIVVASHDRGRISRMAVVMPAAGLQHLYGESRQADRIKAGADDCKARAEISALGGWGVFFEPGAALVATTDDPFVGYPRANANFKTGIFQSEVIALLPIIEPGLTTLQFKHIVGGGEN
jgi:hypothetical protein